MRRSRSRLAARAALAAGAAGLLAYGEWQAWRASREQYPPVPEHGPDDGRDIVLVLGFRSRADDTINALQAWRTRIAVRSAAPGSLLLFSGGAVHGTVPEAQVMAQYAIDRLGVAPGDVAIESQATTTYENITRSLPWLRDARTIRIASNTGHARRARGYLREIDPAAFARLRPTRDFVLFEIGPLRLALTFYDLVAGRAARRRLSAAAARVRPPGR